MAKKVAPKGPVAWGGGEKLFSKNLFEQHLSYQGSSQARRSDVSPFQSVEWPFSHMMSSIFLISWDNMNVMQLTELMALHTAAASLQSVYFSCCQCQQCQVSQLSLWTLVTTPLVRFSNWLESEWDWVGEPGDHPTLLLEEMSLFIFLLCPLSSYTKAPSPQILLAVFCN